MTICCVLLTLFLVDLIFNINSKIWVANQVQKSKTTLRSSRSIRSIKIFRKFTKKKIIIIFVNIYIFYWFVFLLLSHNYFIFRNNSSFNLLSDFLTCAIINKFQLCLNDNNISKIQGRLKFQERKCFYLIYLKWKKWVSGAERAIGSYATI